MPQYVVCEINNREPRNVLHVIGPFASYELASNYRAYMTKGWDIYSYQIFELERTVMIRMS